MSKKNDAEVAMFNYWLEDVRTIKEEVKNAGELNTMVYLLEVLEREITDNIKNKKPPNIRLVSDRDT